MAVWNREFCFGIHFISEEDWFSFGKFWELTVGLPIWKIFPHFQTASMAVVFMEKFSISNPPLSPNSSLVYIFRSLPFRFVALLDRWQHLRSPIEIACAKSRLVWPYMLFVRVCSIVCDTTTLHLIIILVLNNTIHASWCPPLSSHVACSWWELTHFR